MKDNEQPNSPRKNNDDINKDDYDNSDDSQQGHEQDGLVEPKDTAEQDAAAVEGAQNAILLSESVAPSITNNQDLIHQGGHSNDNNDHNTILNNKYHDQNQNLLTNLEPDIAIDNNIDNDNNNNRLQQRQDCLDNDSSQGFTTTTNKTNNTISLSSSSSSTTTNETDQSTQQGESNNHQPQIHSSDELPGSTYHGSGDDVNKIDHGDDSVIIQEASIDSSNDISSHTPHKFGRPFRQSDRDNYHNLQIPHDNSTLPGAQHVIGDDNDLNSFQEITSESNDLISSHAPRKSRQLRKSGRKSLRRSQTEGEAALHQAPSNPSNLDDLQTNDQTSSSSSSSHSLRLFQGMRKRDRNSLRRSQTASDNNDESPGAFDVNNEGDAELRNGMLVSSNLEDLHETTTESTILSRKLRRSLRGHRKSARLSQSLRNSLTQSGRNSLTQSATNALTQSVNESILIQSATINEGNAPNVEIDASSSNRQQQRLQQQEQQEQQQIMLQEDEYSDDRSIYFTSGDSSTESHMHNTSASDDYSSSYYSGSNSSGVEELRQDMSNIRRTNNSFTELDNIDENATIETNNISTNNNNIVEANPVVDDFDEIVENRVQQELQARIQEETINEEDPPLLIVPDATLVTNNNDDSQRSKCAKTGQLCFAFVLIVAVVFVIMRILLPNNNDNPATPSSSPTMTPAVSEMTLTPSVAPYINKVMYPSAILTTSLSNMPTMSQMPTLPVDFVMIQSILYPITGDAIYRDSSYQFKTLQWFYNEGNDQYRNLLLSDGDVAPTRQIGSETQYTLSATHAIERYIVATIYFALQGDGWRRDYDFLSSKSICDWNRPNERLDFPFGIGCSDENDFVTSILLETIGLAGRLPNEIAILTNMKYFVMHNNEIAGPLPRFFANFTKLEILDLARNDIAGSVPEDIFRLPFLRTLAVGYNNLITGSIPATITPTIEILFFFDCSLVGTIPTEIRLLTNLEVLSFARNLLTGTIPNVGRLVSLTDLILSFNQFSALENNFFEDLPHSLAHFELHENQLTGSFPSDFVLPPDLVVFSIYTNLFSGTIPESFLKPTTKNDNEDFQDKVDGAVPSHYSALTVLDIDDNRFSGTIGSEFGSLTALRILYLRVNRFTGTLPPEIGNIGDSLEILAFDGNELSGTIPNRYRRLQNLIVLLLHGNNFVGDVTNLLCINAVEKRIDSATVDCQEVQCDCCAANNNDFCRADS